MPNVPLIRLTQPVEVYEHGAPDNKGKLPTGTLMRQWFDSVRKEGWLGEGARFTERPDGQGYSRVIPRDSYEQVVPTEQLRSKDFKWLLDAMCYSAFPLPHFEPVYNDDPIGMAKLMSSIAAGGGCSATGVAHIHLPDEFAPEPYDKNSRWARLFPWHTQGGALDGRGYIILYDHSSGKTRRPIGGTYSLCQHEYIKQPTGREHRGDHRGRCGKCGLDMSVDSSD